LRFACRLLCGEIANEGGAATYRVKRKYFTYIGQIFRFEIVLNQMRWHGRCTWYDVMKLTPVIVRGGATQLGCGASRGSL